MSELLLIAVGLVAIQRLYELRIAARNTRALLAAGGEEHGRAHYPLIVGLHALWLLAIAASYPAVGEPNIALLVVFVGLQGMRLWILTSLGRYWTTRIITVPSAPLVRRGPYRIMKHPNYMVVTAEIAVLPLAFGLYEIAIIFSILNAIILSWRISVENRVLAQRSEPLAEAR